MDPVRAVMGLLLAAFRHERHPELLVTIFACRFVTFVACTSQVSPPRHVSLPVISVPLRVTLIEDCL